MHPSPANAAPEAQPLSPPPAGEAVLTARARSARLYRALMINPASLLFGPIFGKEMRVMGRKASTYWVRALYAGGLFAIVVFVYYGMMSQARSAGGGAMRAQQLQEFAPILATVIAWFQFVMLILIAPTLTGPCICDEKRARTLASLMTTPMTSAQIIMGKLSSRLVQVCILTLVSAPFLLGVRIFGGLEAESVLAIMAITVSAVLLVASLGVLFSIRARRSSNAAASAIFIFLLVTLGPTVATYTYLMSVNAPAPPPMALFAFSAPISLGIITGEVVMGVPVGAYRWVWLTDTAVNLGASALILLLSTARLRRAMIADASAGIPTTKRKRRRTRRERKRALPPQTAGPDLPVPDDTDPGAEPVAEESDGEVFRERLSFVGDHPVLWRELRTPTTGSRRNLFIVLALAAVLLALLNYNVPPGRDYRGQFHSEGHYLVVIIMTLLMLVHAAIGTTSAVAGERESGTWLALLTTTMSGFEILLGKMLGALKRQWVGFLVLMTQLGIGVAAGGLDPSILLHVPLILLGGVIFLLGTGLLFSVLFKKGVTAAVFNIGLALALWLGFRVVVMLALEFSHSIGRRNGGYNLLEEFSWCINPFAMVSSALDGAARGYGNVGAGYHEFGLSSVTVWGYVFTLLVAGGAVLGVIAGLGAVMIAAGLVNQRTERVEDWRSAFRGIFRITRILTNVLGR